MADNINHTNDDSETIETDGGVTTGDPGEYLRAEINIFKPETAFMRDHLKLIWSTFLAWILAVFGPVTAALVAPDLMTGTTVLGFQLHFFLTAIGAPFGALVLSAVYARQRDQLDEKYGIEHGQPEEATTESATATDGGEQA